MSDNRPKFVLSKLSLSRLDGVHADLVKVVKHAIELTEVDFRVNEGLRSKSRQAQLVASGASQTSNSRHLTGHAVDLLALVKGVPSWDWNHYYKIAEAMRQAADELKIKIEWGGCWGTVMSQYAPLAKDSKLGSVSEQANVGYVAARKKSGKSAFIDGPHFQIPWGTK
ncbi:M15 family metallopeptidase [Acinetobacter piscicola]|uniref:M15 family metallopeptidase n=1 Tax=Acinetobacter piscicola TaxID=2006115 RepID=UPI00355760A6